jgi:transcriptional regulator with XRE-family HTH domain
MERLRQFLSDHHLSQAEFARRLDYHPELISMVLSGKRPASDGLKLRFIEAFGLDSYRSVFVGDDEPAEVPA